MQTTTSSPETAWISWGVSRLQRWRGRRTLGKCPGKLSPGDVDWIRVPISVPSFSGDVVLRAPNWARVQLLCNREREIAPAIVSPATLWRCAFYRRDLMDGASLEGCTILEP